MRYYIAVLETNEFFAWGEGRRKNNEWMLGDEKREERVRQVKNRERKRSKKGINNEYCWLFWNVERRGRKGKKRCGFDGGMIKKMSKK